jgi:hypothetical protein
MDLNSGDRLQNFLSGDRSAINAKVFPTNNLKVIESWRLTVRLFVWLGDERVD